MFLIKILVNLSLQSFSYQVFEIEAKNMNSIHISFSITFNKCYITAPLSDT